MKKYIGKKTNLIEFPLGGIGAGNICVNGSGGLSGFSIRNRPGVRNNPYIYAAVCIKGEKNKIKVLEGQVPHERTFGMSGAATGLGDMPYGLPRFKECEFSSRFPFANIKLTDAAMPIDVAICAWSPFDPPNADNSSYPAAFLEYELKNSSADCVDGVFYFNTQNFSLIKKNDKAYTYKHKKGFIIYQPASGGGPEIEGGFSVSIDDPDTKVNTALFRGKWFDAASFMINTMLEGKSEDIAYPDGDKGSTAGGMLSVAFSLKPKETKKIRVQCCWYIPNSNMNEGPKEEESNCGCSCDCGSGCTPEKYYKPWYAGQFSNIEELTDYMKANVNRLYDASLLFSNTFYSMTLPEEVIEAVSANLSIIKSPTVLRQTDGKMWAWEGCVDDWGCCSGSCTHVWNYAQAISHLFPDLERSLRETEFFYSQAKDGHQQFRAALPIRDTEHSFVPAADGQLGGIIKLYREFTILGDIAFLRKYYPKAKESLDYCIHLWDPNREGAAIWPHHNTYDIEFWGADGMCTSIYLGALVAFVKMGELLGEDMNAYKELMEKSRNYLENKLFDGEFFIQNVEWEGLAVQQEYEACQPDEHLSPECALLIEKEGPRYQYGKGCISDGIIGAWLAEEAGLGPIADTDKIKSHLKSVYKYNFKTDFSDHINAQRPAYAFGNEGGLLLCSWPKGGRPALPFVYSDEVWTGIEYQVASHLIFMGCVEEGLTIVRTCRERYDGEKRNPYDEYECGHWYARALASYSLIESLTGVRYNAYEKTLYYKPQVDKPFVSFLSTDTGYGLCKYDGKEMKFETVSGHIEIKQTVKQ